MRQTASILFVSQASLRHLPGQPITTVDPHVHRKWEPASKPRVSHTVVRVEVIVVVVQALARLDLQLQRNGTRTCDRKLETPPGLDKSRLLPRNAADQNRARHQRPTTRNAVRKTAWLHLHERERRCPSRSLLWEVHFFSPRLRLGRAEPSMWMSAFPAIWSRRIRLMALVGQLCRGRDLRLGWRLRRRKPHQLFISWRQVAVQAGAISADALGIGQLLAQAAQDALPESRRPGRYAPTDLLQVVD